jgi:hypothetical protein
MHISTSLKHHNLQYTTSLTTDTIVYESSPSNALASQLRPKTTHIVDPNDSLTGDKCNSDTNHCQGKLIELTDVPDISTNSGNEVYPARDQQTGIVSIAINLLPKNNWQPRHRLLYQTVNHPFANIIHLKCFLVLWWQLGKTQRMFLYTYPIQKPKV